jgi:NTP pyrophosphatase (non-canonical NTP hydrolase)
MTLEDYKNDCLRTLPKNLYRGEQLLQGLVGATTEAAEALDIHKKTVWQDHPFDREHLLSELGDAMFYITIAADALDSSIMEIIELNVEKRRKRYPNGFSTKDSIERRDGC